MTILILNWRDIKNPRGGGAEVLTHEIAKRLVAKGHSVILVSSRYAGSLKEEFFENVHIIRVGKEDIRWLFFSVHFQAIILYFFRFRNLVDVVIDEVHGFPFFSPLYMKEKIFVLICEIAKDLWIPMYGEVQGRLGRLCEQLYIKFVYKSTPFFTISNSTKADLICDDITESRITVLPMGLTVPVLAKKYKKEKRLTLLFVGRLTQSKGLEDAIDAVFWVKKSIPNVRFWIVGKGDQKYVNKIKSMVVKRKIEKNVVFLGYVTEQEKFMYMAKSHVIVVPSLQEGWGLIVPEAGRVQTPAVVYSAKGLKDIVRHTITGMVCQNNSPQNLAYNVLQLVSDKKRYAEICLNAEKQSKTYNWDHTADEFLKKVQNV